MSAILLAVFSMVRGSVDREMQTPAAKEAARQQLIDVRPVRGDRRQIDYDMSEQDERSGHWKHPGRRQELQPETAPILFFLGTQLSIDARSRAKEQPSSTLLLHPYRWSAIISLHRHGKTRNPFLDCSGKAQKNRALF